MSDIPIVTPAAAPVSVLDAATANAQDQALKDQITALTARVTALEAGQPQPPQSTPSPDGTTVTAIGAGSIIDAKLRAFTLVQPPAGMTSPGIAINGVYSVNTQAVARLYAKGGVCFQQNTAGAWYNMPNGAWAAASDPTGTTPVPPNPGTGAYSVSNGRILDSNGNAWVGNGVNLAADAQGWGFTGCSAALADLANCKPLLTAFPKTKIARIACYDLGICTPQYIQGWVNALTAKGIICSVEYHLVGMRCPAGSELTRVTNWYTSQAGFWKNNPRVWFEIPNEINPWAGASTAENLACIKAVVGAIRGAGNGAITDIAMLNGSTSCTDPNDPWWGQQRNLIMGYHGYQCKGYDGGFNGGDINAAYAWAKSLVQRFQVYKTADGLLPVKNGEYGDSTDGSNVDPDWRVVVQAGTMTDGTIPGLVAATAWYWNSAASTADLLLAAPFDGSHLTPYGQIIHDHMA